MRTGELNRRITIQSATTAQDAFGTPVETWSTFAEVWARVRYKGGREGIDAGAVSARQTAEFRVRHRSGLNRQMRISYDGDIWIIEAIQEIGRREGFDILAVAERA